MLKSLYEKVKWYLSHLPVVSTVLFIVLIVCYKIRIARHFTDVALCVQPHMVMTGQVSRLIKYVVHHKNVKTLLLSLIGLASFGTIAERQAGSVRYLYLMTIFSILSSSLTVFFSILLGFSSQYSSLMYSCPALGLSPALFAILILVFKGSPMKKTVLLFTIIPTSCIPWLLLIASQLIVHDATFLSNLSGCIIGSLYTLGLGRYLVLPVVVVKQLDRIFTKVFAYILVLKFIAGASMNLPLYHHEIHSSIQKSNTSQLQPFAVPDDCPVPVHESSVSQYKLQRFQQMGFSKEESVVALSAASNNVDHAIGLLTSNQIGQEAAVLPVKIES